MKGLARLGAEVRLAQIQAEIAAILKAFPALSRGYAVANGQEPTQTPKRKGMSAAQKREVSRRMKRYWAARRRSQQ
jgi:hypothetical protein